MYYNEDVVVVKCIPTEVTMKVTSVPYRTLQIVLQKFFNVMKGVLGRI